MGESRDNWVEVFGGTLRAKLGARLIASDEAWRFGRYVVQLGTQRGPFDVSFTATEAAGLKTATDGVRFSFQLGDDPKSAAAEVLRWLQSRPIAAPRERATFATARH